MRTVFIQRIDQFEQYLQRWLMNIISFVQIYLNGKTWVNSKHIESIVYTSFSIEHSNRIASITNEMEIILKQCSTIFFSRNEIDEYRLYAQSQTSKNLSFGYQLISDTQLTFVAICGWCLSEFTFFLLI